MSKKKPKSHKSTKAQEAARDDDVVRSVRFPRKVDDAISARASELGIRHATFIRQAAAAAVGMGDIETKKLRELITSLESVE